MRKKTLTLMTVSGLLLFSGVSTTAQETDREPSPPSPQFQRYLAEKLGAVPADFSEEKSDSAPIDAEVDPVNFERISDADEIFSSDASLIRSDILPSDENPADSLFGCLPDDDSMSFQSVRECSSIFTSTPIPSTPVASAPAASVLASQCQCQSHVRYRNCRKQKKPFEYSTDGGNSWTQIRPPREHGRTAYISASYGVSHIVAGAAGFNTAGSFQNAGDSAHMDTHMLGGAVGMRIPFCVKQKKMALRIELEAFDYHDVSFITNSFPGPPGPSAFFYRGTIGDIWTATTNVWLDIPVGKRFEFYLGGGMGAAGFDMVWTDFVVSGRKNQMHYTYNLGVGVNLRLNDRMTIDTGWRYADLGDAGGGMNGGAAGNYELDLNSNQFLLSVRYDLW